VEASSQQDDTSKRNENNFAFVSIKSKILRFARSNFFGMISGETCVRRRRPMTILLRAGVNASARCVRE
jgi:hypothetical protein